MYNICEIMYTCIWSLVWPITRRPGRWWFRLWWSHYGTPHLKIAIHYILYMYMESHYGTPHHRICTKRHICRTQIIIMIMIIDIFTFRMIFSHLFWISQRTSSGLYKSLNKQCTSYNWIHRVRIAWGWYVVTRGTHNTSVWPLCP